MAKYIYQEKGLKVNGNTIVQPKFAHIRKVSSDELIKHIAHGDSSRKSQLIASLIDFSRELRIINGFENPILERRGRSSHVIYVSVNCTPENNTLKK